MTVVKQTCLPSTFALCFYEAWLAIKLALIFWTNFPKPGIGGWTFLAVHECFILFQFIKYLNSWSNNFNWSKPLKPSFLFCPWPFLLVSSHKIMVCDHLKCWWADFDCWCLPQICPLSFEMLFYLQNKLISAERYLLQMVNCQSYMTINR